MGGVPPEPFQRGLGLRLLRRRDGDVPALYVFVIFDVQTRPADSSSTIAMPSSRPRWTTHSGRCRSRSCAHRHERRRRMRIANGSSAPHGRVPRLDHSAERTASSARLGRVDSALQRRTATFRTGSRAARQPRARRHPDGARAPARVARRCRTAARWLTPSLRAGAGCVNSCGVHRSRRWA